MDFFTSFYFVHADALHRHYASVDLGDHVAGAVAKDPDIADLSTGISIEGRVIEHDFALFSGLELGYALPVLHDRQHFAVIGDRLFVTFEDSLAQIAIDGTGSLFRTALPGSARTLALLLHCMIKAGLIEFNPLIASCVDHEIERKPKSVVQLKCLLTGVLRPRCSLAIILEIA